MKTSLSILLATSALALGIAGNASAHQIYVGADYGAAANGKLATTGGSLSLDEGSTYSAAIGYDAGPIRVEVEARKLHSSTNVFGLTVDGDATIYGVNGYFEPVKIGKLEPYAMVGAGKLNGTLSVPVLGSVSANTTAISWGAGASYPLNDSVTLDAGWRHIKADGLKSVDFSTDAFTVGARFKIA